MTGPLQRRFSLSAYPRWRFWQEQCSIPRANGGDDEAKLDVETLVSTPTSSGEPIQQQLAAYLKSKHVEVADLKQQLKASDQCAYPQQLIRDHNEKGVCDWHFFCAKDGTGFLCDCFVNTLSWLTY